MGRLQTSARNEGRLDPFSHATQAAVHLTADPLAAATRKASDFISGLARSGHLERENRRLEAIARAAQTYDDRVSFLQSELERLQALMGFEAPPGKTKIPARVIAHFPLENRITLDAGRTKGVKPNLPVVVAAGLVGVVQTVDEQRSQVLLITSPRLQLGAMVLRDPPPAGLIRGESASSLSLEFLDINSNVRVGDPVVTSGFSEFVPAGIPIGVVLQVHDDPEFGARRCQVFPHVQVGSAREVFVLR